jgi:hypothetical protein
MLILLNGCSDPLTSNSQLPSIYSNSDLSLKEFETRQLEWLHIALRQGWHWCHLLHSKVAAIYDDKTGRVNVSFVWFRNRQMARDEICASLGIGPNRVSGLRFSGLKRIFAHDGDQSEGWVERVRRGW